MQGDLDNPPIILRARRWQPLLVFAVAMTGLNLAGALGSGGRPDRLAVPITTCGLLLAANLLAVLFPARLILAPGGITLQAALRRRVWTWDSLRDFRVTHMGGRAYVGCDHAAGGRPGGFMARASARSLGCDLVLPGRMGPPPEALADLLNAAQARWAGSGARIAQAAAPSRPPAGWGERLIAGLTTLIIGRIGRKTFALAVGALAAAGLAAAFLMPGAGVKTLGWLAVPLALLVSGRLRDLGRSPYWTWGVVTALILVVLFLIGLTSALMAPDTAMALTVGLAGVAVGAGVVTLSRLPGQKAANRFGPAPDAAVREMSDSFS